MNRRPSEPLLTGHDRSLEKREEPSGQLILDFGHETSLSEEDFVVSAGNELAFQHIMAFPEWPTPLALLVGPPKSGKTHLSRIWALRSGARFARSDQLEEIATSGGNDPLVVENADSGAYSETALFHLLNQCMRSERPLLLTARTAPGAWPLQTDDVRSRIRLAAQFQMEADGDIQLSQMLVKLFHDRQIRVDPKIVDFLVKRMERSPEEAVALVALIDELALSKRSPVTRAIAAEVIAQRNSAEQPDTPSAITDEGLQNDE